MGNTGTKSLYNLFEVSIFPYPFLTPSKLGQVARGPSEFKASSSRKRIQALPLSGFGSWGLGFGAQGSGFGPTYERMQRFCVASSRNQILISVLPMS